MRCALFFLALAGCELVFQPRLREEATDASSPSGDAGLVDVSPPPPNKSCTTPLTCGNGDSCCATRPVPGGTFSRSNDANAPATVSPFYLDVYEVTVGRFRPFAAGFPQDEPVDHAGNDPNNPADTGWSSIYGNQFPADLGADLKSCTGATWTDTSGSNETLPINCVRWVVAFAFCAWDGGRLPTEAEWNFAAAGGDDQRVYPWSSPPTSSSIDSGEAVFLVSAPQPVGSRSAGRGRWGQLDLSGNVGEWVLDGNAAYATTCNNCAELQNTSLRSVRGGGYDARQSDVTTASRGKEDPVHTNPTIGFRCARDPSR